MGKFIKNTFGALFGGASKSQKRAQQQAQVQQQAVQISQQQQVNEQSRASAQAMGSVVRRRRGSRLLDLDQGKATLG